MLSVTNIIYEQMSRRAKIATGIGAVGATGVGATTAAGRYMHTTGLQGRHKYATDDGTEGYRVRQVAGIDPNNTPGLFDSFKRGTQLIARGGERVWHGKES
jgi:hypothetical protein